MAEKIERYESPALIRPRNFLASLAADSFESKIILMSGLTQWLDWHSDRVVAGSNTVILSKIVGGASLTEVTAYSGLAINALEVPAGGQMIAHGVFDAIGAPTSMSFGANFPITGAWTKVVAFKMDESATIDTRTDVIWRGPSGAGANHQLFLDRYTVWGRVGPSGGTVDVRARQAIGFWNYVIQGFDNATGRNEISVNGKRLGLANQQVATLPGATSTQTAHHLGGHAGLASLRGKLGPVMLFSGATNAIGNLFDASRTADLAVVNQYMQAQIGRLALQ